VPLEVALRLKKPTELIGEQYGFAERTLDPGGCVGVVCAPGETEEGGNIAGLPAVSDGDPVYESDSQEDTSVGLAIAIAVLTLCGVIGLFLVCTWWKKTACGSEETGRALIGSDEDAEPGGAYDIPKKKGVGERREPIGMENAVYGGASMIYAAEPGPAITEASYA
jgi:hypothetical protein